MTEPEPMTHAEKAAAIIDAFNETDGPTVHMTSSGRIQIDEIQAHENDNTIVVKIHRSDEEIVIVNPPVYRPDPEGEVFLADTGEAFTYDPVGTIAEVIGMHIGAS